MSLDTDSDAMAVVVRSVSGLEECNVKASVTLEVAFVVVASAKVVVETTAVALVAEADRDASAVAASRMDGAGLEDDSEISGVELTAVVMLVLSVGTAGLVSVTVIKVGRPASTMGTIGEAKGRDEEVTGEREAIAVQGDS